MQLGCPLCGRTADNCVISLNLSTVTAGAKDSDVEFTCSECEDHFTLADVVTLTEQWQHAIVQLCTLLKN